MGRFLVAGLLVLAIGGSSLAGEGLKGEKVADDGGPLAFWHLRIASTVDRITVERVVVNRGTCDVVNFSQLPTTLTFGEQVGGVLRCDPIEVTVMTSSGEIQLSWADFGDAAVWATKVRNLSVSSTGSVSETWYVSVASLLESLQVTDVRLNRGNCRGSIEWNEAAPGGRALNFGQRIVVGAYDCNPIEVEVITSDGDIRIALE